MPSERPKGKPSNVHVDYQSSPENLQPREAPRFSWQYESDAGGDAQLAYRILVATEETRVLERDPDVWDSGRVESEESVAIPYAGPSLSPETQYFWSVKIWTGDGTSQWSDPTSFTTAMPSDAEWDGEWVGRASQHPPVDEWSNYTVKSTLTLDSMAAGIVFRAEDAENCYNWVIQTNAGPSPKLVPYVRRSGEWERLETVSLDSAIAGSEREPRDIEISVNGPVIRTSIDGEQVDVRYEDTHLEGSVGLFTFCPCDSGLVTDDWQEATSVRVDDFTVETSEETWIETGFDDDLSNPFSGGTVDAGTLRLDGSGVVLYQPAQQSPLLRREFDVDGTVAHARAHLVSLGHGELHVNGACVSETSLDPPWTEYRERVLYTTHDITEHLDQGPNVIGIWLGRGFYSQDMYGWQAVGQPTALLQLELTYDDGRRETVVTDDEWLTAPSPVVENDPFDGETYDSRRERPGWTSGPVDETGWESVVQRQPPGEDVLISPRRSPPTVVTETFEPVSITRRGDGQIVDFGQNLAGWVELTIEGASEGDMITVEHAEILSDRGDLDTRTLQHRSHVDRYVADGTGGTFEPRFTYHGFRYAKISGYPGPLDPGDVAAKAVHTDLERTGSFSCSDDRVEAIQRCAEWGIRNCAHGIVEDTPVREKRGWTGDSHMAARATQFNFDAIRFHEKWTRDHDDNQRPDGSQTPTIPDAGGQGDCPTWTRSRVTIPWYSYLHTGDERFLSDRYDRLCRYVDCWHDRAIEGIVPSEYNWFGDWLSPAGDRYIDRYRDDQPRQFQIGDPSVMNTAVHYQTTRMVARAAEVLGHQGDAKRYADRAETILEMFDERFFDPAIRGYGNGSQTSRALPLFVGIVPDRRAPAVKEGLVERVREDGQLTTGFVGTRPLLFALSAAGESDLAYKLVTQGDAPSWGRMVDHGATATWENFSTLYHLYGNVGTRNHSPWSLISEWFHRVLAGIEIVEPGYERFRIDPAPVSALDSLTISVDTVRGEVTAGWERTAGGFEMTVGVPWNSTCEVAVPVPGEPSNATVRAGEVTVWDDGPASGFDAEAVDGRVSVPLEPGRHDLIVSGLRG
jgi:alpha-L-rhamnosidase